MKRMLFTTISLCLLAMLFSACTTTHSEKWTVNKSVFEKQISNFNIPESISLWQTEDNATINRIELKDGNHAAALHLPKYISGPHKWPLMQLTTEYGLPSDWSAYDALRLDCRKKSPLLVLLGIFIKDTAGGKTWLKPALDRETWQTVQLPLANQKIDPHKIDRLRIYVTQPGADMEINIKNIKLVSFLPEKMKRLAQAYRSFGDDDSAANILATFQKLNDRKITLTEGKKLLARYEKSIRTAQMAFFRTTFKKKHPAVDYAVLFADSMEKVLPRYGLIPGHICSDFELSLAKNEYEAFQVVIVPPKDKDMLNVSLSVSCDNTQLEKGISVAPVGFVKTKQPIYPVEHIGWYPDPILEFTDSVNIKKGEVQPFWIRVHGVKSMKAGVYQCQLTVKAKHQENIKIPFIIKVFNFTIPEKGHLRTAVSLYPSSLLEHGPQMYQAYDYVLDKYRINPFSIYTDSAYGKPKIHPISEYTKRLKLGLNAIPIIYLKLPRQALHRSSKNSKTKWEALPTKEKLKYPKHEAENVMRILAKRVPEMKRAGLYDMAYCYGMDEATIGEWPACADLCKQIKSKYPDLKIYSTAYDQSYGTKSVLKDALDGWIPHDNLYDFELAEKVRKHGKEVWWYSTRMFIDEKPLWTIRSKMGEEAFKNKVDGFLYWCITRWSGNNAKPITKVPYTDWNSMTYNGHNGGGSFLCMGPNKQLLPTIRLANIRDGLEDYEYFYLLNELVNKTPANSNASEAAKAILKKPFLKNMKSMRDERKKIADLIEELQHNN